MSCLLSSDQLEHLKGLFRQDQRVFWNECRKNHACLTQAPILDFLAEQARKLSLDEQKRMFEVFWGVVPWTAKDGFLHPYATPFIEEALQARDDKFIKTMEEAYTGFFERIDVEQYLWFDRQKQNACYDYLLKHPREMVQSCQKWSENDILTWGDVQDLVQRFMILDTQKYLKIFLGTSLEEHIKPYLLLKESIKEKRDFLSPVIEACEKNMKLAKEGQLTLVGLVDILKATRALELYELAQHADGVYDVTHQLYCRWVQQLDDEHLLVAFYGENQELEGFLMASDDQRKRSCAEHLLLHDNHVLNSMPSYQKWVMSHVLEEDGLHQGGPSFKIKKM